MDDQRDYAEEAYNLATMREECLVECEVCGDEVREDFSTDDGMCLVCAMQ